MVGNGEILVEHIVIEDMLANPLTKGLRPIVFIKHVENIGVVNPLMYLVSENCFSFIYSCSVAYFVFYIIVDDHYIVLILCLSRDV